MRFGRWTDGKREAPEPLEGNPQAVALTGICVWAALFLAQVPFYGWYADQNREQWIWSCLVGVVLGFLGLWYIRRRESGLATAEQNGPDEPSTPPAEDHSSEQPGS